MYGCLAGLDLDTAFRVREIPRAALGGVFDETVLGFESRYLLGDSDRLVRMNEHRLVVEEMY